MRPESLTMQAFGSYGRAVTIDFRKPEQNLFLITGDTGAGKTTIFDALVFALYGEASSTSNRKDGTELQSQFVSPELEPFVELTFSELSGEEQETYTVRRSPQHRRPLRRKGKYEDKLVGERVDLTLPGGQAYTGNLRDTNAKIQEIVGLSKSQFMQVAMIAQGEFMELLRADSSEKKEIFRRLFGTDLYRDITEELRTRRARAWDEVEELGHYFVAEAGHVVIPQAYEEAPALAELQSGILGKSDLSAVEAEALVQKLGALCSWLQEQKDRTDTEYQEVRAARDAVRDAYSAAESLTGFYRQYDQARLELDQCDAEAELMQGRVRLRQEILGAQEIRAAYARLRDAEQAADGTERNLETQRKALPGLQEALKTAGAKDLSARSALQAETEAYSKAEEKVRAALETFTRIAALEKEAETARKKQADARARAESAEKALQKLEQQEKDWRTQLDGYSGLEGRRTAWTFRKNEAVGIRADLAAAVGERQQLQKQLEESRTAAKAYGEAAGQYDRAKETYDGLYRAYLDAQAGFLAAQLRPGVPCPVCGSMTHPHPCALPEHAEKITREMLEEEDRKLSACKERQEQCAAASHAAEQLYREKKDRSEETMRRLRDRFAASFPEVPAQIRLQEAADLLNALLASLRREDRELKERENTAQELRRSLEGVDTAREQLRGDRTASSAAFTEAAGELAGKLSALEQLRGAAEYPDAQAARAFLESAKSRYEEMSRGAADAAKELRTAQAAEERAQALIRQFEAELPGRREAADRLRRSYEALLNERALSEEAWKDLAQRYQAADAERMQKEIEAYGRRKASAESALKVSEEAIASRERPALGKLEEARDAAEQLLADTEKRKAQIDSSLTADLHARGQLEPGLRKWKQRREGYQRLSGLYRQLAGRNPGQRMDIETFVQRYYLERILDAANARFLDMSAGQFELRMCDLERAGEGKNRGLDLMVYSTVTGKEREVRTLSGGESFMAALSLALGMADQIRENAANVNLDILFIDEGFGSLDSHSRDQAVKVLQQMAGGSRLIGIISHVTEMKQEIEDQLVVTKDEDGSHVRWMLS